MHVPGCTECKTEQAVSLCRLTCDVTCACSGDTFQHISVSKRVRQNCLWTVPSLCSAVLHSQCPNHDNGRYRPNGMVVRAELLIYL
jgi:hypothetical protein